MGTVHPLHRTDPAANPVSPAPMSIDVARTSSTETPQASSGMPLVSAEMSTQVRAEAPAAEVLTSEVLTSPAAAAIASMQFEQVVAALQVVEEGSGPAVDPRTCGYIAGLVAQAALASGDRPQVVEAEARAEARARTARSTARPGSGPQPAAGEVRS
jgi:hypothetical protein